MDEFAHVKHKNEPVRHVDSAPSRGVQLSSCLSGAKMSTFKLASKVAFGAARCAVGVKEHEDTLVRALRSGIKVIETSANYTGGNSEKLVGHVLNGWSRSGRVDVKDVTVISKFGYASTESGAPGLVQVTPDLCHSLHADFFRSELKGSMNRLNMQRTNLGAYLIEHPEANLAAKLGLTGLFKEEEGEDDGPMPEAPNKAQLADARGELYEELTLLFEAMEERAGEEEGRFVYGVSCNSLSLPSANLHVSWEELVRCAEKAASRAGRERHSFRLVEMPGNLLEITGLPVARAMQKAGIEVLLNDPLAEATSDGKYLLSDDALRRGIPPDYMDVCREALEHFNLEIPDGREPTEAEEEIREGCRLLQQLIQGLNSQLTQYTSFKHYESELAGHITPLLDDRFEELDETSAAMLQAFFERYGDMVRYSCAEKTREMVKSGENCPSGPHPIRANEPLQTYAIRWLTEQAGVSCVVADMETAKQVDDAALALPTF